MKRVGAYAAGAAILCAGIAAYIVQDLIMKIASGHYPIHQALVLRAVTAIPVALLIIHLTGSLKAIKGSTRPMLPRSLLTVACNLTYYLAIAALPLATVGALYLSAPLMITALSVLLLQEKVNGAQWAAVAAGFVGVVLIIHPGYGVFEWAMVLPLLSALTYAGAVIYVRKAGGDGDSGVMSLQSQAWLSVTGIVLGLLLGFGQLGGDVALHPSLSFLLSGWQWPSARDAGVLLLCGVVGSASTYLLTKAYSLSDASRLAPFEYTALLWSIFLGWLVWGHLPAAKDWLGIALLVGAGLVSVYMAEKKPGAAQQQAA
jgi:drug/metabolite transporter (DMT)-like permease